jgi:CHC2 zinc finger
MTLEEIKERFLIDDAYALHGLEHEHRKLRRCPLHDDRNPSFSIFDHGRQFHCFGCGAKGDGVDLVAALKGITLAEARQLALKYLGAHREPIRREQPKREHPKPVAKLEISTSLPDNYWELFQRVAASRGLSINAIAVPAAWLETVTFGTVCEQECWIISDDKRKCAEARRIDRKPFPAIGTLSERKAHTLGGSIKSWPVGLFPPGYEESWLRERVFRILLVEGGPDYLAACQLIAPMVMANNLTVLPVAMLGASQEIASDALKLFTGRRVTILGHPDESGRAAAMQWGTQIQGAGGLVQPIQLKERDLCEMVAAGATYDDINTINRN